MLVELALFFVVPFITSGMSPADYPLFFGLTVGFSVLTLIFLSFTCMYISRMLKVKKRIEQLLKKQEEKAARKKRAAQRKIEPELIEQTKTSEPGQRAVDMTKKDTPKKTPEASENKPENETDNTAE